MTNWIKTFQNLAYFACLGTIVISLTAFLGLWLELPELRQWFGEGPPMRANTALGLLCAALAWLLRTVQQERLKPRVVHAGASILALISLLLGMATLLHYGLSIQSGLDEFLFQDNLLPMGFPGRPSPETAIDLILLGLALLIMDCTQTWALRTTRILSLCLLVLPLITLISSFFGADTLYSILPRKNQAIGAATNTTIAFILMSFAIFFRRPDQDIARIFVSDTMGGLIARRQLTTLIILPILIVFLAQLELSYGRIDREVAQALAVFLCFSALMVFNWVTAHRLDRSDRQKQSNEQQLKDQEKLLTSVLDTVPVGIWITDASGNIIRGNPAAINIWCGERYVGINEYTEYKGWWADTGELIGAHDWAMARALEKGETSVDETIRIECFDGSRKVILHSAIPLRNDKGDITGALATNYDISRRYRLEKNQMLVAHAGEELLAMRDLETTFSLVAKLVTDSFCDCSIIHLIESDGDLRLVSKSRRENSAAERFEALINRYPPNPNSKFGLRGVMEMGRSFLINRVDTDIIASIAQDEHHAAELRDILHSYMIVPMMVGHKAIGVISMIACQPNTHFDDIDLAAAEELGRLSALAIENARYAEKLRQAIQVREDVVAIVSHDLRSPLTVILQSCELLQKRLDCGSTDTNTTLCKLVNLAHTAARRMHELIADLLDLSHLESGQFVLKHERIDCVGFIQETVDLLSPIASKKGVILSADLPLGLPMLKADRTRLTQILLNLINNAIKHTPSGGTVAVSARLRDDGWIEVSVNDSGCGIRNEYLPVLFDRYWKPHDSQGGYGLGLFVVKGIVEAHGGSIHVTSEENKGTCFSFTLPTILVGSLQNVAELETSRGCSS